jgi:Fe-S oxidoreductase
VVLPKRLRLMEAMLPRLPEGRFRGAAVAGQPAAQVKATVALLEGCVMPLLQPQTHEATVRVLARNGCRVLVPQGQNCCGALHLHNGDRGPARDLARSNIDLFLESGADYIVVNAAGCGSAMKEYGDLFASDPRYAEKAALFASRVRDVNELLVELGFEPPAGAIDARVTYQDSCHLVHAQRVREAPRTLLRSIPGLQLTEMTTPDRCCGSAGIYNLTQTEMSRRLLDLKMDDCLATGCDLIATANPGCILQLQLGVRERDATQEVVHVVDLLDRAYRSGDSLSS